MEERTHKLVKELKDIMVDIGELGGESGDLPFRHTR